jgi:hypothetical protein
MKCFWYLNILTAILLLGSCSKEDELPSVEMITSQPQLLSVNETGVVIRFDFPGQQQYNIQEYGLIWYLDESNELSQNCVISRNGQPDRREMFEINAGLPPDGTLFYFRAYIKTETETIFSRFMSVISAGCLKPVINNVSSADYRFSQQLTIEAENIIQTLNPKYQKLNVGNVDITPDSIVSNKIYFKLPQEYYSDDYYFENDRFKQLYIRLTVFGYECETVCEMTSPWKSLDLPEIMCSPSDRGSALTIGDKAYMIFSEQTVMYVMDMASQTVHTVNIPVAPQKQYNSEGLNACLFNEQNILYMYLQGIIYRYDEDRWTEVSICPGYELQKAGPHFFHYSNGEFYTGNFDMNIEYGWHGYSERNFWKYNFGDDTWSELCPIPDVGGGIGTHFTFASDEYINIGAMRYNLPGDGSSNRRIWSYSIRDDIWSWEYRGEYVDFPDSHYVFPICISIQNDVFLGLGRADSGSLLCSRLFWKLNEETKQWLLVPGAPNPLIPVVSFIWNNKAYILGNEAFDYDYVRYFLEFDPSLI